MIKKGEKVKLSSRITNKHIVREALSDEYVNKQHGYGEVIVAGIELPVLTFDLERVQ